MILKRISNNKTNGYNSMDQNMTSLVRHQSCKIHLIGLQMLRQDKYPFKKLKRIDKIAGLF